MGRWGDEVMEYLSGCGRVVVVRLGSVLFGSVRGRGREQQTCRQADIRTDTETDIFRASLDDRVFKMHGMRGCVCMCVL